MKKRIYLGIFIICTVFVSLIISMQYQEYKKELELVRKHNQANKNVFNNKSYDVEQTKKADVLTRIKQIDEKLFIYNSLLPKYDNAKNFSSEIKKISNKTHTDIKIISNLRLKREFFNENLVTLIIKGNRENLKNFSELTETTLQLHSWKDIDFVQKNRTHFQVKVSIYSQSEDDYQFNITKKMLSPSYIESKVWLPYLSSRSNENIKTINKIIKRFKVYKKEVDMFYIHNNKKWELTDKKEIIDAVSKNKKTIPELLD